MDALQALKKVYLFSDVPEDVLKVMAQVAEEHSVGQGERIVSADQTCDTLYVVRNGSVRGSKGGDATTLVIGPGGSFGQLAILDGGTLGMDAVAMERTDLLLISEPKLRAKLAGNHEAAHHLYRAVAKSLASRLRRSVDALTLAREAAAKNRP